MFDSPPPRTRIGTVVLDPLLGELLRRPVRSCVKALAFAVREGTLVVHHDGTLITLLRAGNRFHACQDARRLSVRVVAPEIAAKLGLHDAWA